MRAVLPYPIMTVLLVLLWLLLAQSVSPGNLLLGALAGVIGPFFLKALDVPPLTVRSPKSIVKLAGRVFADIVRSNIAVFKLSLKPLGTRQAGFVIIPLDIRAPYGLVILSCIITATPGTSWVSFKEETGELLIHVLDLAEDDDWANIIKNRYEGLLMEIFE